MENRLPITPFKFKGKVKPSVDGKQLHAALEIEEPFPEWWQMAVATSTPLKAGEDYSASLDENTLVFSCRMSVLCALLAAVHTPFRAGEAVQDYLAKHLTF